MTHVTHIAGRADTRWAQYEANREMSRDLFQRARDVLVAGVNHNIRFTPPFPLYFQRGDGAYKWDVDGNRYVDYALGSASLLLGHQPRELAETIREGVVGVPAGSHKNEIEWAEAVKALVPSAEKVRFVSSGSEATSLAIRLARTFTGRSRFARFPGHYHGWHDQFMIGNSPPFDAAKTGGIPQPIRETVVVVDQDERSIEAALAKGDVAAVILEPSGANWGTVPLREGLLAYLRDVTRKYGSVLIFDEMITGFRFSPGGAQAREGIVPDLTTLGKILTGGLPGGAVAGRGEIMDLLSPGRPASEPYVFHYGTFNGHPITAAVGLRTLREVASGQPTKDAEAYAAALRSAISEVIDALSIRGHVYGPSSTFHVYLAAAGSSDEVPAPYSRAEAERLLSIPKEIIEALHRELRLRGVDLMSYNGGVTSAAHGDTELQYTRAAFEGALVELREQGLLGTL
jgi:glutamate-1-semialdehyde 2,1-aminomutase